eukprot:PhF_6_TR13691/c1_g2_i3/m.22069
MSIPRWCVAVLILLAVLLYTEPYSYYNTPTPIINFTTPAPPVVPKKVPKLGTTVDCCGQMAQEIVYEGLPRVTFTTHHQPRPSDLLKQPYDSSDPYTPIVDYPHKSSVFVDYSRFSPVPVIYRWPR